MAALKLEIKLLQKLCYYHAESDLEITEKVSKLQTSNQAEDMMILSQSSKILNFNKFIKILWEIVKCSFSGNGMDYILLEFVP